VPIVRTRRQRDTTVAMEARGQASGAGARGGYAHTMRAWTVTEPSHRDRVDFDAGAIDVNPLPEPALRAACPFVPLEPVPVACPS
jgi:hypothetical protein